MLVFFGIQVIKDIAIRTRLILLMTQKFYEDEKSCANIVKTGIMCLMLLFQNAFSGLLGTTANRVMLYSSDQEDLLNNTLGLLVLNDLDNLAVIGVTSGKYTAVTTDDNYMRLKTSPLIGTLADISMIVTTLIPLAINFILLTFNIRIALPDLIYDTSKDSESYRESFLVWLQMFILTSLGLAFAIYVYLNRLRKEDLGLVRRVSE